MSGEPEPSTSQASKEHTPARTIDPQYLKLLKLGVAMAIIRTKPEGMTGQQYAERLCNNYQKSQMNWKEKSEQLQQELLSVRQKLLLNQVSKASGSEEQTAQAQGQDENRDSVNVESLPLFPTPPCSSEELRKEQETYLKDQLHQHTAFLQAVMTLRSLSTVGGTTVPALEDRQAWEKDIKQSIASAITAIEKCICGRECLQISDKILHTSVSAILHLVASYTTTVFTDDILEHIAHFLQSLLMHIVNQDAINKHSDQQRMCQVLLMFGHCHRLHTGVVKLLTRCISEYGSNLRSVSKGKAKLQPHEYENMYYVFWSLQQLLEANILNKGGKENLPQEVVVAMETELEDSLLHISDQFPLFTHYVWEIGALLQCLKRDSPESEKKSS